MTVHPAKTWITLIRVFAVRSMGSLGPKLSSDAQADLILCWAHIPFCWFCHEAAHLYKHILTLMTVFEALTQMIGIGPQNKSFTGLGHVCFLSPICTTIFKVKVNLFISTAINFCVLSNGKKIYKDKITQACKPISNMIHVTKFFWLFSAQLNIILRLFHISQDFIDQITSISKCSQ